MIVEEKDAATRMTTPMFKHFTFISSPAGHGNFERVTYRKEGRCVEVGGFIISTGNREMTSLPRVCAASRSNP